MVKGCIVLLAALAVPATPVFSAVLAVGHGTGESAEAAQAAARDDLALRLQRLAEARIEADRTRAAASVRLAIAGGRELPVVGVDFVNVGTKRGTERYEARLTDASLAMYRSEAGRLAKRLHAFEPARLPASRRTADGLADWIASIDQYRRISAVLIPFSREFAAQPDPDEAALWAVAAKNLTPIGGPKEIARSVKRDLDRAGIARVRVIAPVRANTQEVAPLAASIADELRKAISPVAGNGTAAHTLDGRYAPVGGRLLVTLFLMDASFNTRRAFVFALPGEADQDAHARTAADALGETLSRGLVRVEMQAGSRTPSSTAGAASDGLEVSVRMGRGHRGLYYRPGDRDRLFVKLDRPGFYFIVGHVEKAGSRFSYLMEIGQSGAADRFVRRVQAGDEDRWQDVGEFTVEGPTGLEAVQVFATSSPPGKVLPAARFDPVRRLHVIGADPVNVVKRTRGLVRVTVAGPGKVPPQGPKAVRFVIDEAVLQFSTLQ